MKKKIPVILLLIFILVYALAPAFFNSYHNQSLSRSPVILLVGDFSKQETFGAVVYQGVNEAQQHDSRKDCPQVEIRKVNVNDSAWEDSFGGSNNDELQAELDSLHDQLLREIVAHNVVAIISANTSQTVNTVLDIAKSFNLPVLVTVATSTSVLQGYELIAFRLIASDTKQAEVIHNWATTSGKRIALLYDSSRYGIGLRNSLMSSSSIGQMLPYALNTTTDLTGILRYAESEKVQTWVVVGYRNQAIEFVGKLQALGLSGNVLFSDGAYGTWLTKLKSSSEQSYYLSFPAIEARTKHGGGNQLEGYSVFGFDAYHLICRAMTEMKKHGQEKKYLLSSNIRQIAPKMNEDDFTRLPYSFDSQGENAKAQFSIIQIK